MGIREDVAEITRQARVIGSISEEIETEGEAFWSEHDKQVLLAEREQWLSDQQAIAEYEAWEAQKLLADQDAEGIAEQ